MNTYQKQKEKAMEYAIEWQYEFAENSYTWSECAEFTELFKKIGKRYGLLKEFGENGII